MSDSTFIIGVISIIVVAPFLIFISWLLFRKSALFTLIFAFAAPLDSCALVGFIMGAKGLIHLVWCVPVVFAIVLLAIFYLKKIIIKPITEISDISESLSKGQTNVQVTSEYLKRKDEIGKAAQMLDKVVESLKGIVSFANNIGKGNLSVELQLTSDKDEIGKSMIEMRDNLKTSEIEKQERQEEDKRRNWITDGIAKFAEILRTNSEDLVELSNVVISNLVKYVEANQGGIFILNDDDTDHPYLEMTACYAYERKKFMEKRIEMGEGLIGTCYLEGESIYMTDLPKDYVHITSGLGDNTPNALLITPLKLNDEIYGVIELASFKKFEPYVIEFVEKVAESIASSIGSVKTHMRTNMLLERSKIQAEEMANQEEELRQNMEEMQATQEESRRRENELKLFVDAIYKGSLVLEYDMNRKVIFINDKFLELTNFSKEQVIGASFHDFIREEYDLNGQSFEEMWTAIYSGESRNSVMTLPIADGKDIILDAYFTPIADQYGKIYKVMVVSTKG